MQTTHDPPNDTPSCDLPRDRPLTDNEVLMPRRPRLDRDLVAARAHKLASPASYQLLSAYAKEDLLTLVRDMAQGRYRWRRTRDGHLAVEGDPAQPVPDLMSFRVIDDELERRFGQTVSYETLRRWWGVIYPDEPPSAASRPAPRRPRTRPEPEQAAPSGDVPPVEFLPPSAA